MEKETAVEVRRLALRAVESLSAILRITAIAEKPECHGDLRRAVGILTGETDFAILVKPREMFPELGKLE